MSNCNVLKDILEKKFGKGSVTTLGDEPLEKIKVIPTGIDELDNKVLGCGGIPEGRMVEVFGQECVDENTFIPYKTYYKGIPINTKGGTIKRLYDKFHNVSKDGRATRFNLKDYTFRTVSVNNESCIQLNDILDVVKAGPKECVEIITSSGNTITCTKEHEILIGAGQFVRAGELSIGSKIGVHNNTPFKVEKYKRANYPEYFVKYHPANNKKIVSCNGIDYTYFRIRKSRAVYEAYLNNISLEKYIQILNSNEAEHLFLNGELSFLPKNIHVHHVDNNPENNNIDNLELISPTEHGKLHATERHNSLRFIITYDEIVSINEVGIRETYDIKMASPMNNYIANKIAVHNSSGKTTLCLLITAKFQKAGKTVLYIDTEHALDLDWANQLNVDTTSLIVSQPDCGEQALEIMDAAIKSDHPPELIVVDSVAALTPKAELEGNMGDANMGLQARLMSQACRKLTASLAKSKTTIIWINQVRDKIGIVYGNPTVTTGGKSLKFYASIRLDIARTKAIKEGDEVVGHGIRIKCIKNKLAAPFRECELPFYYVGGLDNLEVKLSQMISRGEIEVSGKWYVYDGHKYNGKAKMLEALKG